MNKKIVGLLAVLVGAILLLFAGKWVWDAWEARQVNLPFEHAADAGTAVTLPPNDLANFSDDFEDNTLADDWDVFNEPLFTYDEVDGRFHMIPLERVTWYRANNGPFIYQLIEGDFMLTTRVQTRQTDQPDEFPNAEAQRYEYAGIMMRDPVSDSSGLENYLFAVVGFHSRELAVETKSTLNDVSEPLQDKQWESGDAELRICRMGDAFYLFKRHLGETEWVLQQSFERPDIGPTVQAGLISYAQNDAPDLDAAFEFVSFQRIDHPSACIVDES